MVGVDPNVGDGQWLHGFPYVGVGLWLQDGGWAVWDGCVG